MLNYANNKNTFIRKKSNGRFGFKAASEILRHDQHTTIPGGRIREIRFFGLRTLTEVYAVRDAVQLTINPVAIKCGTVEFTSVSFRFPVSIPVIISCPSVVSGGQTAIFCGGGHKKEKLRSGHARLAPAGSLVG